MKPVMYVAAAGLTPRFPVMAEVGTVEIPVFASKSRVRAAAGSAEHGQQEGSSRSGQVRLDHLRCYLELRHGKTGFLEVTAGYVGHPHYSGRTSSRGNARRGRADRCVVLA